MIVPFPAGGATDVIARVVVDRMQRPLGQRLVIENVGGADGSIGLGRAARARPDGYTPGRNSPSCPIGRFPRCFRT